MGNLKKVINEKIKKKIKGGMSGEQDRNFGSDQEE